MAKKLDATKRDTCNEQCHHDYSSRDHCSHYKNNKIKCNYTIIKELCKLISSSKIGVGIIMLLIAFILIVSDELLCLSDGWANFYKGIGYSLVSGVVISFFIDIPNRLQSYKDSFIDALTDDKYVKSLTPSKLRELRQLVTQQLHRTKAPYMSNELVELDDKICNLLQEPYYATYDQTVSCHNIDDTKVTKTHTIYYELINPRGENNEAEVDIGVHTFTLCDNKAPEVKTISVIVDGKEQELEVIFSKKSEADKDASHKTSIFYMHKKSEEDTDKIKIRFKKKLCVDLCYSITIDSSDNAFTKRLRYPTKKFSLNYLSTDNNVKLYAQILGSLIEEKDVRVTNISDNNIKLATEHILLPQNGIFVVMLKT